MTFRNIMSADGTAVLKRVSCIEIIGRSIAIVACGNEFDECAKKKRPPGRCPTAGMPKGTRAATQSPRCSLELTGCKKLRSLHVKHALDLISVAFNARRPSSLVLVAAPPAILNNIYEVSTRASDRNRRRTTPNGIDSTMEDV